VTFSRLNYILTLLLFVLGLSVAEAQWDYTPLTDTEKFISTYRGDSMHTGIRPLIQGFNADAHVYNRLDTTDRGDFIELSAFGSGEGGYQYMPFHGFAGTVVGGASINMEAGKRFFVDARYAYVLSNPLEYVQRFADSLNVLPGIGYAKHNGTGWQSHYYAGKASFNINKHFSAEIGNDKNFWGDGYRSLILSHNAAPYPYAKLTTDVWRVRYVNIWAKMKDISRSPLLRDAKNKYVALHALSWNATKRITIGVYEMVVWQARDTLSNRGVDLNYVNPIIFYRPSEFAQGSADNVLLAFSLKVKASKKTQIYGQMLIDELVMHEFTSNRGWWGNKFGYQLGIKTFDLFTEGLNAITEFNIVRPFTYTHGSITQAYGHLNQPVAHPLGTNFVEWLALLRYEAENWTLENTFVWAIYGRDRNGENYGGNIFRSYKNPRRKYGNYWAQGLKSTVNYNELVYSRLVWPEQDLWAEAKVGIRHESNEFHEFWDGWFMIGLRMDLIPRYLDF
jgi:hypothetical protein